MKAMIRTSLLLLLVLAAPCASNRGLLEVVRHRQSEAALSWATKITLSANARAEWVALVQVEADDRQFWASEWAELESTLLQLQTTASEGLTLLQAGNVTDASRSTKLTEATAVAKQTVTSKNVISLRETKLTEPPAVTKHSAPAVTKHTATSENATSLATAQKDHTTHSASTNGTAPERARRASPLTGIKINLNPKSVKDLMPALAMLKGLYEDAKERIAELNAREKKYKEHFEEQQKEHAARLATIEARFKNHTLSAEFRTNETRDENRLFSYWERVRERQHRQFHTSLKIQHGTMEKEKMMIDAYEKTIAGTANRAQVKKELAKVAGVPEVVLVQVAWQSAALYFREALAEVRAAQAEFRHDPPLV